MNELDGVKKSCVTYGSRHVVVGTIVAHSQASLRHEAESIHCVL